MAEPLKNLYNRPFFDKLIEDFKAEESSFDEALFLAEIFNEEWEDMELKARLRHITHTLHKVLHRPYRDALAVLKPVASKQPLTFEHMFFPDYVEVYGQDDWDASFDALEHFTKYSSSEFAVRPFIAKDPERVMKRMLEWSLHENEHVRRFSSEGCRPRLPWAMALPDFKKDPSPILPILENLKADDALYVRKSVANNLNDIAKDHPDLVIDIAKRWHGSHKHTDWIVKHGCRTLLKQGRPEALMIFGFGDPGKADVQGLKTQTPSVKIGDDLHFSFELSLHSPKTEKLRVEYAIFYLKANGSHSKKVFQITETEFPGNSSRMIEKKQSFKNMTTRKHYPGQHFLGIMVNGVEKAKIEFEVV